MELLSDRFALCAIYIGASCLYLDEITDELPMLPTPPLPVGDILVWRQHRQTWIRKAVVQQSCGLRDTHLTDPSGVPKLSHGASSLVICI